MKDHLRNTKHIITDEVKPCDYITEIHASCPSIMRNNITAIQRLMSFLLRKILLANHSQAFDHVIYTNCTTVCDMKQVINDKMNMAPNLIRVKTKYLIWAGRLKFYLSWLVVEYQRYFHCQHSPVITSLWIHIWYVRLKDHRSLRWRWCWCQGLYSFKRKQWRYTFLWC